MKDTPLAPDTFVTLATSARRPEMSILMPVFEQEALVGPAIHAALAQRGVTCEVIISDDASSDSTFARVLNAVQEVEAASGIRHTVVVRRGTVRQRRDHLHFLAERATCDVVMQAHGDDVSLPDRAQTLLAAMEETGAAMAASTFIRVPRNPIASSPPVLPDRWLLSMPEVVEGQPWLIGSTMSWRRSALDAFTPLTARDVPTSHDRIMAVRAWLVGGVVGVGQPLVRRRIHDGNWGGRLVDRRSPTALSFGQTLNRLCFADSLLSDTHHLVATGDVDRVVIQEVRIALEAVRERSCTDLRADYGALSVDGRLPLWADEEEFRLAFEGSLLTRLKSDARRLRKLSRLASLGERRLRGW